MSLLALGLNHKTAPVNIREQLVFAPERITSALHELTAVPSINEAAIISTCNRTEVYCNLERPDADKPALQWFLNHHGMQQLDHDNLLYQLIDAKTVRHLLRVACGLDSMVIGEPQILGQLKSAYRQAEQAGTIGGQLGKLFQHAFSVAKQVRSDTAIGANPVSVAFAAVRLAKQIFSDLSEQTALMIGAGETIELVARHLQEQGINRIIVANRSLERARQLAARFNGTPVLLSDLCEYLPQADILISSTASQLPIIGKGAVESTLKKRKHRPVFMIDLAVPRDIESQVGDLEDVYLYNIDDLQAVIEENLRSREDAAVHAETIIDCKVSEFIAWQRSLDASQTIRDYREDAVVLRESALQKARQLLAGGKSPEESLEYLAHNLTNKLLHNTTIKLDKAARDGRQDILQAAYELFRQDNKKNN